MPTPGLPDALRWTIVGCACDEIESLGERINQAERQLEAIAEQTPVVERLRSIPGIGLMTSTALVAFVGDIQRFPSGRHFASYLGLTPREYSSGLRQRLGRISKRGDSYLRMLLVHGARSVLCHAKKATTHDRLRTWALELQKRSRHNKAAVALANKLARIAWAVWKNGREYESIATAAAVELERIAHPGLHGDRRDGETGRTGERKADNKGGLRGRFHRLAPARADSIMARGRAPQPQRPKIRLQSDSCFAIRWVPRRRVGSLTTRTPMNRPHFGLDRRSPDTPCSTARERSCGQRASCYPKTVIAAIQSQAAMATNHNARIRRCSDSAIASCSIQAGVDRIHRDIALPRAQDRMVEVPGGAHAKPGGRPSASQVSLATSYCRLTSRS